ncbi:MAG: phospholipase D-like domain-containing protein, partial [Armatimonadota bacterium]|nr:phospholipase D-like domain-containing protein [Armatimonadota bacterium]
MPATTSSIIDNRDGNTLQVGIENITGGSRTLCIATAFFSLDALGMVACNLHECESVRILFGDDSDKMQRVKLLRRLREQSDADLADRRMVDPTLSNLAKINELFKQKRIQARCYTSRKFHAKAYLTERSVYPHHMGILGSGNFTGPGLTRNIELNVVLTTEQTAVLSEWYEERWAESVEDDVTADLQKEIKRQIELYDPYAIYQRALLAWGDWIQGREALPQLDILNVLDPHQEDAYRQALKIIERERGVLISDGVGLGKSFVALALMEHFLARGKRAFLIAPKAILTSSWEGYLKKYLDRYRRGFNSLTCEPMTWFGYDPKRADHATETKLAELTEFAKQADVVVIDESHNFRKTGANRYVNLMRMLQEGALGPKAVILLTATPINTEYRDLAAQFRLITQEKGHIGGIPIEQYQKAAVSLDREKDTSRGLQIELDFGANLPPKGLLKAGLQTVAIQRSRRTCKEIAAAHGRVLRFPER